MSNTALVIAWLESILVISLLGIVRIMLAYLFYIIIDQSNGTYLYWNHNPYM